MGLYEDMLARVIEPEGILAGIGVPAEEGMFPMLSAPHKRSRVGGVDASSPSIRTALGENPGPILPQALQQAGMIPGLNESVPDFNTGPARTMMEVAGVDPGPLPPMPRARPADAPQPPVAAAPPAPIERTPVANAGRSRDFEEEPAATEVSAQSRPPAPMAPPLQIAPAVRDAVPEAQPQSLIDRIRTGLGDNSNTLLALGAGFAGAPNWGQAIHRAASAAIPARQADIRQSLQRQQLSYGTKALVEAGVPVQQAIAASTDPELKKALIQQYITERKGEIREIGTDRYGNKVWGVFDPYTRTIKPVSDAMAPAAGGTTQAAASGSPAPSGAGTDVSAQARAGGAGQPMGTYAADTDVTGPDYLEQLKLSDPAHARRVESIINGNAPYPSGKELTTPYGKKLVQDVLTVEPGSTANDFKIREGVRKDYASGLSSRVLKAVNTAVTHGAGLQQAIDDLHNYTIMPGVLNPITGAIQKQFDPKYQEARKKFAVNAENFVRELDFAISGGRPTVSGAAHQREAFDINASPQENRAALLKAMELLKGRLDSQTEGYNKGMRTQREGIDFIDPVNRSVYRKLLGETDTHGAPAPAASAGAAAGAPALQPKKAYKLLPDGTLVEK